MRRIPSHARLGAIGLAFIGLIASCPSRGEVDGTHTPSPTDSAQVGACGEVIGAPTQLTTPAPERALAVYSYANSVWLYDASADSATILRRGNGSLHGLRPRFFRNGMISFVDLREKPDDTHLFGRDSIYELVLGSRQVRELLRLPSDIRGYDWSPDGTQLMYQLPSISAEAIASMTLCLYDSRRGETRQVRKFGVSECTTVSQEDEQSVAWSSDGISILIVDTCQRPSLHVVDRNGEDSVQPRSGTFARWLPNRDVLFREIEDSTDGPWLRLDLTTGETRSIAIPAGTFRPALSPDGKTVAYDDGNLKGPSVFLYDLGRQTHRRLGQGYAAPIWLSRNLIAATAGAPCPANTECHGWWQPLNRTAGFASQRGGSRRLALQTTLPTQARLFSSIDVLLGN